jgi:hypothetical protein
MGQAPHPEVTKGDWVGGGAPRTIFKRFLTKVNTRLTQTLLSDVGVVAKSKFLKILNQGEHQVNPNPAFRRWGRGQIKIFKRFLTKVNTGLTQTLLSDVGVAAKSKFLKDS